MPTMDNKKIVASILPGAYSSTQSPAGADISNFDGNIGVYVATAINTEGTVVYTVQHNDVAAYDDGGWAAVPAAALVNRATGAADTFDAVNTTANDGEQQLMLVRNRLNRYVRVVATISGSGNFDIFAGFVGEEKYPE